MNIRHELERIFYVFLETPRTPGFAGKKATLPIIHMVRGMTFYLHNALEVPSKGKHGERNVRCRLSHGRHCCSPHL
jgi:hypothetical protein